MPNINENKKELDDFFDLVWNKNKNGLLKALTKKEIARFFFYLGEKFLEKQQKK